MGGGVVVESTLGVGSEFRVTLEFALASERSLARQQHPASPRGKHPLQGVRVLVVDDSDINLDVTKRILELEGAQVLLACNGQEAFERIQAQPRAIDVVLMDVQMPVLDGHDATRRIRLELRLADLPIIALTAGALSSERQRAAAAGMDDYITKPFDANALVSSILRHVKPDTGAPDRHHDAPDGILTHAAPPWMEIEGIDSSDARGRLSGDFDLFRSLLKRLFCEFTDVTMPDRVDLTVHAGRMHKLRGSAGMLGAKAIHQLAGKVEAACVAAEREAAWNLAARLATLLERLRECAQPALSAARAETEQAASTGDGGLEPHVLADFIGLLREQSLSAMNRFSSLSPQLRRVLSSASYDVVREHMDNLQFSDAADALEASQR
jgi:CheY-like chemotaxis protein